MLPISYYFLRIFFILKFLLIFFSIYSHLSHGELNTIKIFKKNLKFCWNNVKYDLSTCNGFHIRLKWYYFD